MSSSYPRPIQAGDLVICVRGHGALHVGGVPFKVERLGYSHEGFCCGLCGTASVGGPGAHAEGRVGEQAVALPLSWLIRIDPPASGEYDRVPTREPVKVPQKLC